VAIGAGVDVGAGAIEAIVKRAGGIGTIVFCAIVEFVNPLLVNPTIKIAPTQIITAITTAIQNKPPGFFGGDTVWIEVWLV
jgi:hypothetical protein